MVTVALVIFWRGLCYVLGSLHYLTWFLQQPLELGPYTTVLMKTWTLRSLHSLAQVTQLVLQYRSLTLEVLVFANTIYFHPQEGIVCSSKPDLVPSSWRRTQIYSITFWNVQNLEGSGNTNLLSHTHSTNPQERTIFIS